MKIGFFNDSYFPRKDGLSYTLKSWKKHLEDRGHEVHIYYPRSPYEPEENEHPQRSIKDPFFHGHYWPLPDFSRIEEDLDVVHCNSPWLISYKGLRYSRKNDIPSIFTYHSPLQDYFYGLFKIDLIVDAIMPILNWIDRNWMKKYDVITCSADAIRHESVDYQKLPVGVDEEFFQPHDDTFLDDMDLERPLIGYSGRISEEKNLEEVMRLAENFDGSIVISGNGRNRSKLEKMAPENVKFFDFHPRERLPEFYSGIDVFVTASSSDTFSLTTMEANLCGTPVLAPDVPPFDETIKQRNGRRYELGDINDMKTKLENILESEFETREEAMKYSVKETVKKLEKIYENANADRQP